jgi:hypothetical protein
MQEQRSREAKKAVARFIPIQLAMPFQQNPSPSGLSILLYLSFSLDKWIDFVA